MKTGMTIKNTNSRKRGVVVGIQNRNLTSVTSKKSPNIYKEFPKNDFTRKMKDFYKNCPKCRQFGQNNCCHRL